MTSKVKHAVKLKIIAATTSSCNKTYNKSCKTCTTVAQLLQPSLAFCFNLH